MHAFPRRKKGNLSKIIRALLGLMQAGLCRHPGHGWEEESTKLGQDLMETWRAGCRMEEHGMEVLFLDRVTLVPSGLSFLHSRCQLPWELWVLI